jgi:hypothetical protein
MSSEVASIGETSANWRPENKRQRMIKAFYE